MCVCVCVCRGEREREGERENYCRLNFDCNHSKSAKGNSGDSGERSESPSTTRGRHLSLRG